MVLALAAVQNKHVPKHTTGERILGSSKLWLWATAIAGTTFLGFQAFEFTSFVHEGLSIRTNLFGSSFFTLTGFPRRPRHRRCDLAADAALDRLSSAGSGRRMR
jgi:heme/copper-type cytochrome/quinol oxidase subunit 3